MKNTYQPTIFLLFAVLLSVISCQYDRDDSIFFSLENEEKIISKGSLNRYITVVAMAEANDHIFIAAGTSAYKRVKNTAKWNSFSIDNQSCVHDLAYDGTAALWAITSPLNGESTSLYKTTDGHSWLKVSPPNSDNPYSLVPITGDGSVLSSAGCILVTYNQTTGYTAYLLKNSTIDNNTAVLINQSKNNISTPASIGSPITTAVFDGTSFYLQNRSYIWKTDFTTTTELLIATREQDFGAMIYLSSPSYLNHQKGLYITTLATSVSDSSSKVSRYDTNGNLMQEVDISLSGRNVSGTCLFNDAQALLIGGNISGYGELKENMSFSRPSDKVSIDRENYYSTLLARDSQVLLFYYSTYENRLFLSAAGEGLWVRDSTNLKWSQE